MTPNVPFEKNKMASTLATSVITTWSVPPSNFIAGRPKAALLFWFFGGFRCGVPLFIVMLVIY